VHAILNKNNPGTTLLERSAFMRNMKYNIGGVMHSLLDVSVPSLCLVGMCRTTGRGL
jgi:hypothetical protein